MLCLFSDTDQNNIKEGFQANPNVIEKENDQWPAFQNANVSISSSIFQVSNRSLWVVFYYDPKNIQKYGVIAFSSHMVVNNKGWCLIRPRAISQLINCYTNVVIYMYLKCMVNQLK